MTLCDSALLSSSIVQPSYTVCVPGFSGIYLLSMIVGRLKFLASTFSRSVRASTARPDEAKLATIAAIATVIICTLDSFMILATLVRMTGRKYADFMRRSPCLVRVPAGEWQSITCDAINVEILQPARDDFQ